MAYEKNKIEKLNNRYNPERDLIPDAPWMTACDFELLDIVKGLLERIEALEEKLHEATWEKDITSVWVSD